MKELNTAVEDRGTANASAPIPTPATANGGEIRLSFRYFFVVLKWGNERRSSGRIAKERREYPALTATHAPVLAAVWAAIFLLSYFQFVLYFLFLI